MPDLHVPDGFLIGAATASYQIEGATDADGRGESIWDRFASTPGAVVDGDTGDVACDHYRRVTGDVALMAGLGLDAYRFSVAWPRVIPGGRGAVNGAGLDWYDRLVDQLLAAGIKPFVTLYHWDLPQPLEDAGGWPSRDTAYAFADYAAVVAARLGDRAASIATLNEPWCAADLGYRQGIHAPGRRDTAASVVAGHHLLLGHGLAMEAIRAAAPGVPAGIVLNFSPLHPATGHPLDLEATADLHAAQNRWYLDPLVGLGYPALPVTLAGADPARPEILAGDMATIAAPLDFLGINYYMRWKIRSPFLPALPEDPATERTEMGWEVYPDGLVETLQFVASRTGDLPLYVTENGAAYPVDPADPARDPERTSYIRRHLAAALSAKEAGVNLAGWFAWSLLDNFEWAFGYSRRFGIVGVDYATQERVVRDSARLVSEVARTRTIPA